MRDTELGSGRTNQSCCVLLAFEEPSVNEKIFVHFFMYPVPSVPGTFSGTENTVDMAGQEGRVSSCTGGPPARLVVYISRVASRSI